MHKMSSQCVARFSGQKASPFSHIATHATFAVRSATVWEHINSKQHKKKLAEVVKPEIVATFQKAVPSEETQAWASLFPKLPLVKHIMGFQRAALDLSSSTHQ